MSEAKHPEAPAVEGGPDPQAEVHAPHVKPKNRRVLRHAVRPVRPVPRRLFVLQGAALLAAAGFPAMQSVRKPGVVLEGKVRPIRPPSASLDERAFQSRCIGCGLCGTVCENGCIRYFALDEPHWGALTPYLDTRRRSCTLCMRCTQICPTGALRAIEDEPEAIKAHVRMGKAVVDPEHCLSYLGRLCGYCHDACPLPNHAIRLTPPALPAVQDGCVGCGRCEEFCPQTPTAIWVRRDA